MSKNNQHVVPNSNGGWDEKGEGNSKATKHFETKEPAVDFAREIARNNAAELVIHGKDGRIQDKDSYGGDTNPPKDWKH